MRRRLLWPRLTSAGASPRLPTRLALRHANRSPGVRHVTFSPSTRRIYDCWVRVGLGFRFLCPLAPQRPPLYALRVPRAGDLPRASSPRRLATTQLPLRLGVPPTEVSKGLSPPSHFPLGFRLAVASTAPGRRRRDHGAARRARRTKKNPPLARRVFQVNAAHFTAPNLTRAFILPDPPAMTTTAEGGGLEPHGLSQDHPERVRFGPHLGASPSNRRVPERKIRANLSIVNRRPEIEGVLLPCYVS